MPPISAPGTASIIFIALWVFSCIQPSRIYLDLECHHCATRTNSFCLCFQVLGGNPNPSFRECGAWGSTTVIIWVLMQACRLVGLVEHALTRYPGDDSLQQRKSWETLPWREGLSTIKTKTGDSSQVPLLPPPCSCQASHSTLLLWDRRTLFSPCSPQP